MNKRLEKRLVKEMRERNDRDCNTSVAYNRGHDTNMDGIRYLTDCHVAFRFKSIEGEHHSRTLVTKLPWPTATEKASALPWPTNPAKHHRYGFRSPVVRNIGIRPEDFDLIRSLPRVMVARNSVEVMEGIGNAYILRGFFTGGEFCVAGYKVRRRR